MHKNNKHKADYNFDKLCENLPELNEFVFTNKYDTKTVDFSNPKAVKALNTALLISHYNIKYWNFPDTNLCPPIPSRVDYIHYLADLIQVKPNSAISILDIGTGATCIYPLLGNSVYQWKFVGTEIDENSIQIAEEIISKNKLNQSIDLRLQTDKNQILKGIIHKNEKFTASMCNPPFYKSFDDAKKANARKQKNLGIQSKERNFSGNSNELWYKGGEKAFLHNYLYESSLFKDQCDWFTSLVSSKELVKGMYTSLKKLKATQIKTIEMNLGNKITRIVAWRF
jgi:23S rRNA (adenine1618-N6)-methyltransferase